MKPTLKPTLKPKLRFPEFRNAPGWDTSPGDELFNQISNREAPAGLPILAITQEHGAIPRDAIDYHVSATDKSVETYKEVLPGDFIISLRSFQGGIEYSDYHGICSPAYIILRKRTDLADLFYKHLFKSHRFILQLTKNLEGLRDGKMISYKQFSELLLPAPSPPEQHKIASCLSSLDDVIGAESQKLDALKAHKKGLMQQLFPREGETRPRLRFPEFRKVNTWRKRTIAEVLAKVSVPIEVEAETTYREIGVRSHGRGIFHKEPVTGAVIGEKRVFKVVADSLVLNIVFAWEQAVATTSSPPKATNSKPSRPTRKGSCSSSFRLRRWGHEL